MSARKKSDPQVCPVKTAVGALGGKWKPLIVYYLRFGTRRFSELRRLIPEATQQMLTQQLRQLERDGVVKRTVYPEVPPKVEYALTPLGRQLEPILDLLERWGKNLDAYHAKHRKAASV
ncbi:MAG TPA: helix-turn-helix domain-containing protein [Bryobacteraceae bacterium]|jgi:DNA-binding HxlR family transcriptional regulator|nr:helix-turn-helix domain-containing protein [Bryobacteraceae bacterium]